MRHDERDQHNHHVIATAAELIPHYRGRRKSHQLVTILCALTIREMELVDWIVDEADQGRVAVVRP